MGATISALERTEFGIGSSVYIVKPNNIYTNTRKSIDNERKIAVDGDDDKVCIYC